MKEREEKEKESAPGGLKPGPGLPSPHLFLFFILNLKNKKRRREVGSKFASQALQRPHQPSQANEKEEESSGNWGGSNFRADFLFLLFSFGRLVGFFFIFYLKIEKEGAGPESRRQRVLLAGGSGLSTALRFLFLF